MAVRPLKPSGGRVICDAMKYTVFVLLATVVLAAVPARADKVLSKRDRELNLHVATIRRPNVANKLRFEKECAQAERDVQLGFDRITAATGVRPSELWVKTWTEAYYSHSGGRHSRTHFEGYRCVLELESRAEHLGFVTVGSQHYYKDEECAADRSAAASRAALVFQRTQHGYDHLGFGYVERIEVLPVYEGRRAD